MPQKGGLPWAIITNDTHLTPAQIVELYDHRNLVEKVIEEVKNDYAIQKLPRKKFTENTCYVLLTLWSYNLLNDYALTVLQKKTFLFNNSNHYGLFFSVLPRSLFIRALPCT